ncbi:MAG: hypothetical protein IKN62_06300 [Elusimicrobia bacterium]|nr:hypothetical protein [Elusimicrobiota bacterium]
MGIMISLKCTKNEKHNETFLIGRGKGFPKIYQQVINSIIKGKYGEEIKQFLKENPKGAINCEYKIAQCKKCNHLERVYELSMYIPRKNYNPDKAIKRYINGYDLKTKYKKIKEYQHICPKCKCEMDIVKIKYDEYEDIVGTKKKVKCLQCDGFMKISYRGRWD